METNNKMQPVGGFKYRHYKGGIYTFICIAKNTETMEDMVIYQGEDGRLWARPKDMFNELVTLEKGIEVKRFELID